MRLKEPKPERRRSRNTAARTVWKRIIIVMAALVILGLAGTHLFSLITGNETLAIPEDAVASVLTPLQTGFSSVVDSVVNYLYKLKLRANLELAYNELKQQNEQLVYQAMLADELRYKLSVYEDL